MFEGLRAPFTIPVQDATPVLRAGGWLLKACGLAAAGLGVGSFAVFAWTTWQVWQVAGDLLWFGSPTLSVVIIATELFGTLGVGLLATSMFGTTLLRWEERDPRGRTYMLLLGWFLAVSSLVMLPSVIEAAIAGRSAPATFPAEFWAYWGAQIVVGGTLLALAYHPVTRQAMTMPPTEADDTPPPSP